MCTGLKGTVSPICTVTLNGQKPTTNKIPVIVIVARAHISLRVYSGFLLYENFLIYLLFIFGCYIETEIFDLKD